MSFSGCYWLLSVVFTISPGVLLLCCRAYEVLLLQLGVKAWAPEVGDLSLGLGTTRALPTSWNMTQWELCQRPPISTLRSSPPQSQQAPNVSCQYFSKTGTQLFSLAERLLKASPRHRHPKNMTGNGTTLQRDKARLHAPEHTTHSPNQETFTRHWSNSTHEGQTPQLRWTMTTTWQKGDSKPSKLNKITRETCSKSKDHDKQKQKQKQKNKAKQMRRK